MYPMSLRRCRFVELGFIFVYWTLNLSLSSSRYCIVPAPGRHGADHSRSVSVSYYPYRNRITCNLLVLSAKRRPTWSGFLVTMAVWMDSSSNVARALMLVNLFILVTIVDS